MPEKLVNQVVSLVLSGAITSAICLILIKLLQNVAESLGLSDLLRDVIRPPLIEFVLAVSSIVVLVLIVVSGISIAIYKLIERITN